MLEFIMVVGLCVMSFLSGLAAYESNIQEKCIAKYSDMPHNKVTEYCENVLKFEKDSK